LTHVPIRDALHHTMTRKLYAIADVHLSYPANRDELALLRPHPDDGLILAGDLGESAEHIELAFRTATAKFSQVFWCPGNHELYTLATAWPGPRGEEKYLECVSLARKYGVHTPEDEYVLWESDDGKTGPVIIALTFTLYDYSWRPESCKTIEDALQWAEAADTIATDEFLLHPDPYASRQAWCAARIIQTERKLEAASKKGYPLVIVNHWPLRQDLVHIPRVPRFVLWCGTTKTEQWHTRFNAKVVVSGHLHVRRTDWKDGTRFEEVSFGYPRQWDEVMKRGRNINDFLREILPGPEAPESGNAETVWRRWV
jgi:predicted phosphodiesterase